MPMSDAMGRVSALLAALGVAAAAASPEARAAKADECLSVITAPALAPGAKKIRCVDNDPACDVDPTVGVCRVEIGVCVNATDPTGRCAPRELETYEVANVQPDTDPRHVFEFMTLQDAVNSMALPADPNETDECVDGIEMWLPLEVKIGKKGAAYKKFKQTVHGTVFGPDSARDDDSLTIQCVPAPGSDPCAQVASTLEQLEEQVFFPTCSRDTCHSGPQSDHSLTLLPGDAYTNLVGIMPDNLVARLAGKLRVDPGHPENSFLLDKLRGELAEDEGERMPRGLGKVPAKEIALVEAWIAAGAPETGFVSGIGCQAP
jgi:hypothetical protein